VLKNLERLKQAHSSGIFKNAVESTRPMAGNGAGWPATDHIGIPTADRREGERLIEHYATFVSGYETSAYGIVVDAVRT
jgi:hypothetical protein